MAMTALLSAAALLLCILGAGSVNAGAGFLETRLFKLPGALVETALQMGQKAANVVGYAKFEDIKVILFTSAKEFAYKLSDTSRMLDSMNTSRPTVIYLHGYDETRASASAQAVASAFLQRGTHNFVLFDFGAYVGTPYMKATLNLPMIAPVIGAAVKSLRDGLNSNENLWIVGHSLGAQLAGMLSKHTGFKPRRITGLDPSGPGFGDGVLPGLGREDAAFVDVIHTDAGNYGYSKSCGHVDFWPNGGRRFQPGCPTTAGTDDVNWDYCSHRRSWQYFAESLNSEEAFPAVLCDLSIDFKLGFCWNNKTVYLGYRSEQTTLRGDFYLRTDEKAPYGLGRSSLTPSGEETPGKQATPRR